MNGIAKGSEDIEVCCCLFIKDMVVNCHIIHHAQLCGVTLCFHLEAPSGRFFGKKIVLLTSLVFFPHPIVPISVAFSGRKINKQKIISLLDRGSS